MKGYGKASLFNMKTACIIILSSLLFGLHVAAQSGKLPAFRMTQPGGKVFKAEDLPMGKPIMLVYFSPECDHCITFMHEFLKRVEDFKKTSVVMMSYLPVEKVAKFVNDYKTDQYPNMYFGTEGTSFFVRNYYQIKDIPFTALFDKNGNFIRSYEREIPLDKLKDMAKTLE